MGTVTHPTPALNLLFGDQPPAELVPLSGGTPDHYIGSWAECERTSPKSGLRRQAAVVSPGEDGKQYLEAHWTMTPADSPTGAVVVINAVGLVRDPGGPIVYLLSMTDPNAAYMLPGDNFDYRVQWPLAQAEDA